MTHPPVIYLSAATRDLDSTRHQVTELLAQRGCRVVLPSFTPDGGNAEALRELISSADMVIQIIGYRSTLFVKGLPPSREMIYVHALEADLASKLGKPVHPIFLTEEYPTDPVEGDDDPELSERHRYWREFMRSDQLLYIPANESELMTHVQRLHVGPFHASAVGAHSTSSSASLSFHS